VEQADRFGNPGRVSGAGDGNRTEFTDLGQGLLQSVLIFRGE